MTVFDFLRAVQARPGMYLGYDPQQKAEQLRDLQTMLRGYSFALTEHGIEEPGVSFIGDFTKYIASRGWKHGNLGPVFAIVDAAANPEQAWDDFWRLIWEYEATLTAGVSSPQQRTVLSGACVVRPSPGTPGHAVNRLLRLRKGSDGRARGTPNYHASFERLPAWLEPFMFSGIVGVYENEPSTGSRALVFFDERLLVFDADGSTISTTVGYDQIIRALPFTKDPVARELSVEMKDGSVLTLPVEGREGDVSLIARVLVNVRR